MQTGEFVTSVITYALAVAEKAPLGLLKQQVCVLNSSFPRHMVCFSWPEVSLKEWFGDAELR